MIINKQLDGTELNVSLVGRLDTVTAPQLEKEVQSLPQDVTYLRFDFEGLEYISSAGLRVLLSAQKRMNAQDGVMTVGNVSDVIMEVFEMTGFADIMTVV
jgi:anti-sigma B factor antagonist